jgi:glycosyltransferase involved in cell wall biosynthesis
MDPMRRKQGWSLPDFAPAELIIGPDRAQRAELIGRLAEVGSYHIVSGLRAYPDTAWTMRRLARTAVRIGIYCEPLRQVRGSGWILRHALYRLLAARWRDRLQFMLVTGARGVLQYQRLGFPEDRVFPFAYVVSESDVSVPPCVEQAAGPSAMRILFVGQFVRRKRLSQLLHALARLNSDDWTLEVVGTGDQFATLRSLAERLGLGSRLHWSGPMPNQEVRKRLRTADLLVLPSDFDGWGAVVNEALIEGTRVVVSDACGAADLVVSPAQGYVYRSGSEGALVSALQASLARGRIAPAERAWLRSWASAAVGPAPVAEYLIAILESVDAAAARPLPPWCA